MVDYSEEEAKMVKNCLNFYKVQVSPAAPIDRDDPEVQLEALEYCHSKRRFIDNSKQHDLMYAIMEKNGVEVESNVHRQARLAKERKIAIINKRRGALDAEIEEKKKELKDVEAIAKQRKKELDAAVKNEENISVKEANAKKAQAEAEAKMKAMQAEMEKMKALMQKNKNGEVLKEAAAELAKEEAAVLTKEPPTEIKEPETSPASEEKTIDELIETLK